MKRNRFARKQRVMNTVPTASMADIAFLLLIFFATTSIIRMENGLNVTLPRAQTSQRHERDRVAHIWVDVDGNISINDRLVHTDQVEAIVKALIVARPDLVVAFNADSRAPYRVVSDVIEELKDANAVRVSFATDTERSGKRPRPNR